MSCECKNNEYKEKFRLYLECMEVPDPSSIIERDLEGVKYIATSYK